MKKFLATMLAVVACVGLASCTPKKVVNNANNGNTAVGLVSERVANETAWQNAFDGLHTHFTLDAKMETLYTYDDGSKTDYAETTTITMIAKGDEMSANAKEFALYEDGTVVDDYVEETYLKKVDGTYYQWFRNDGTYGEFTDVGEWEETATRLDCTNWNDWLPETGMMTTDVFADKYELFSYDETEKVYVYNDNVQTGFSEMAESAFDNTGFGLDDAETLCYKVWIKDGKVAKVYVELKYLDGYDEGEQASYTPKLSITYTFGVGEPNLPEFLMPENTQVANETAWQNAFDGLHTHFTLDVKMETPYTYDDTTKTDYAETVTMTIIAKGDEMSEYSKEFYLYEDGVAIDDYWSEFYLKKVDGTYYRWFRNWVAYGEFTDVGEWEEPFMQPDYANWNDYLPDVSMMSTDVFADKYELFSYDETEKVYAYNGNVQTGFSEMAESAFDNTGFGLDDAETLCYKVWIKDGKVAKVYVELKCLDGYDEGEQASYTPKLSITYTFGVGEPNLPEFVMPE